MDSVAANNYVRSEYMLAEDEKPPPQKEDSNFNICN